MREKTEIIWVEKENADNLLSFAKPGDACRDLVAKSINFVGEFIEYGGRKAWKRLDYIEYDTGVKIAPDDDSFFSITAARSSVSKYNLVLANGIGIIDNGYRGNLIFRFKYIWQPEDFIVETNSQMSGFVLGFINEDKIYKVGDRIGQIRFERNVPILLKLAGNLPKSDRGGGNFGSTGY